MEEPVKLEEYEDDFSFYNIHSLIDFVKNNVTQILLLLLVFVIIYIVDHISNINTFLMAMQQQQEASKFMKKTKNKSKK
jgi:hypothetical protein